MTTSDPGLLALLEHASFARKLARRLIADEASADDAVQEAWLSAIKENPEFRVAPTAWLSGVLKHHVLRRRRTDSRRRAREEAAPVVRNPSLDPSETAERVEAQRRLSEALAGLAEPYRTTLVLRYFEDLDAREIGSRMGTEPATVRWRLHEGHRLLREALDREVPGGRSAWCRSLVLLAGPPSLRACLALAVSATLRGGLLMKPWVIAGSAAVLLFGILSMLIPPNSEEPKIDGPGATLVAAPESARAPEGAKAPTRPLTTVPFPGKERSPLEANPPESALGFSLRARFLDPLGNPLQGIQIGVQNLKGLPVATSDADGVARIESRDLESLKPFGSNQNPLTLWLQASGEGRATCVRQVQAVVPGLVDAGDIVLCEGGNLRGQVRDAAGRPVEGALVQLVGPDEALAGSAASNAPKFRRSPSFLESLALGVAMGEIRRALPSAHAKIRSEAALHGLHGVAAEVFNDPEVTETDSNGRYELNGVRSGSARLRVDAPKHPALMTDRFEVPSRGSRDDLHITLAAVPSWAVPTRIRVRTMDGQVSRGARLAFEFQGDDGSRSADSCEADSSGAAEITPGSAGSIHLRADPRTPLDGGATTAIFRTGTAEVILDLESVTWIQLRAEGRDSRPIQEFQAVVRVLASNANEAHTAIPLSDARSDDSGLARLALPSGTFEILVTARGYKDAKLGPFDPSAAPLDQKATLEVIPGIHVWLTDGNAPVGDAALSLQRVRADDWTVIQDGFLSGLDDASPLVAATDSMGRAAFEPQTSGRYVILAKVPGRASSRSEVIGYDADSPRPHEVRMALTGGGTLRGRVLVPVSRSAAGVLVGVSQGFGEVRSIRTDSEGGFRFDDLTPGGWMVRRVEHDLDSGRTETLRFRRRAPEPRFDVLVVSGATATFDLDLRSETHLLVNVPRELALKASWKVSCRSGATFLPPSTVRQWQAVDETGLIRLEAALSPILILEVQADEDGRTVVSIESEFCPTPGPNSIDLRLPIGSLEGRLRGDRAEARLERGTLRVRRFLELSPDGHFGPLPFPAGIGTLRIIEGKTRRDLPVQVSDHAPTSIDG